MTRDVNDEVDIVSAGLVLVIIGLLLVQSAPMLSDSSYNPMEKTGYEDKTTRFPDYVASQVFVVIGIFTIIIGCAVFLKNFINQCFESLNQSVWIAVVARETFNLRIYCLKTISFDVRKHKFCTKNRNLARR